MRKIWDTPGGVHPPENKKQSNSSPIRQVPLPQHIVLPLSQHLGAPARCLVAPGEQVLKGQKVAEANGLVSAAVHASTSGRVVAIEERPGNHPSGLALPSIVIECDGEDRWAPLVACENYLEQPKESLLDKIRDAGIAGLGGAGFPTSVKLQTQQKIHTLIINGTECEPYITADDTLMRENAEEIIAGANLLAYLLDQPQIIIGIEDNKPEAIASMRSAAQHTENIEVVDFPTKYPSGGEKQLIQILTGKEVSSGTLPAELGMVVQNVGTARAAYRAVRFGEPLIQRVTTVVGESLSEQGNAHLLIGTPVEHVLKTFGYQPTANARVIIGGPMMGFTLHTSDAPVIKTTNCVLAPSHTEMPPPPPAAACIRCGMCAEACPASLLPQQLFWYAQAENYEALNSHNLFDCIECGACSYVCPSHLPLVQYYRSAKGEMKRQQTEKEKSDRSRERFEFRKERLAKAEAEKEAKRLARKKAAEEAKQKMAAKTAAAPEADTQTATKQTQAATQTEANAAPIQTASSEQDSLNRNLIRAQERLENTQKKLEEATANGEPTARLDALAAKVKQAQQKLREAEEKLSPSEQQVAIEEKLRSKIEESPQQKQARVVASLQKRLSTAQQKLEEAEAKQQASAEALRSGVEKLKQKLHAAEAELNSIATEAPNKTEDQGGENKNTAATKSAAEVAIEKAKLKAAKMASMSDDEKAQANISSLESRLQKAKARLEKAEQENSENVEAFSNAVAKLEQKLEQAREARET